jgi:hypothetical protein
MRPINWEMNEIGLVEFQASSPLVLDSYEENRLTGSFILIDPLSNATVGAAMIYKVTVDPEIGGEATAVPGHLSGSHVGVDERSKRHQHLPAVIAIDGQPGTAERLEESLFAKGFEVLLAARGGNSLFRVVAGAFNTMVRGPDCGLCRPSRPRPA